MYLQRTGIPGLDALLGGGIPPGSIILLAGNPGTGKTTFAAKFLYEGAARFGEPGIYVSFVEPKRDFYNNMRNLGLDFEPLEKKGVFKFHEVLTLVDKEALSELLEQLLMEAIEMGAKRLVIDSVSALLQIVGERKSVRELLHNFFIHGVKQEGITTILIAELPIGESTVGHGIEEFIVDGVIILKMRVVKGRIERLMEIRKLRSAPITLAEISFRIAPKVGIDLRVPPAPEELPGLPHSSEDQWRLEMSGRGETKPTILFSKGSQVLLVTHPLINTLHLTTWLISLALKYNLNTINTNNLENVKILYRSYFHSPAVIRERLMNCLKQNKIHIPEDNILVRSINPTLRTITDIAATNIYEETSFKPTILVVEGLDVVYDLLADPESYRREHYNNIMIRRKYGITSIYTFTAPGMKDVKRIPLLSVYDYVFRVRPLGSRKTMSVVPGEVEIVSLKHLFEPFGFRCRIDPKDLMECKVRDPKQICALRF
ncbi:MAG: ATPase domain-containing protein [Pyrodictiaceae archaeon]